MKYPITDHFDGTYFYNKDLSSHGARRFFDVLKWRLEGGVQEWPVFIDNQHQPKLPSNITHNEVFITYINHSTELIQLQDLTILTDPVFSERVSPISQIGPKRVREPALILSNLPKIDVVVISHNHYDHMDILSLIEINKSHHPYIFVPLANAKYLKALHSEKIIELDWWQEYHLNQHQSIILTPAQHWSGRGLFDRYKSLWGGYLIVSNNMKIFFAGDTGHNHFFQEIAQQYNSIDIAILPIGSYEPRWFMQRYHMNPEEAVLAHLDLKSKLSIATHFGTFQLSNEAIDDPIKDLQEALDQHKVNKTNFIIPEFGETIKYTQE